MTPRRLLLLACLSLLSPAAIAADGVPVFHMEPAAPRFDPQTRPLRPVDPASAADGQWYRQNGRLTVRNVSVATITRVLPAVGRRTGASVVIAPGGGFTSLAIETEGFEVARALADRGIAAFVLRYRLQPTPVSLDDYRTAFNAAVRGEATTLPRVNDTPATALADGAAAIDYVRANSRAFGIDPERVGVMGFSAGGVLARSLGIAAGRKPAFVAAIYPRMTTVAVPADAPPLFAMLASDDPVVAKGPYALIESWRAAGRPIEFHLIATGGHGFGVGVKGTSSEGWLDGFERWLRVQGLLGKD